MLLPDRPSKITLRTSISNIWKNKVLLALIVLLVTLLLVKRDLVRASESVAIVCCDRTDSKG